MACGYAQERYLALHLAALRSFPIFLQARFNRRAENNTADNIGEAILRIIRSEKLITLLSWVTVR